MRRGQSGLEYIFVFGFSLFVIAVLWTFSSNDIEDTRWDLQVAYGKGALTKIAEAADTAYVQGPPSQSYIYPAFPENVIRVVVGSNEIRMEMNWKGTPRNISVTTLANVTGSLSGATGTHKILVKAESSFVNITEA